MAKLTRRGLLVKTSVGVAGIGGLAALIAAAPKMSVHAASSDTATSAATGSGNMAYVEKDGSVHVMTANGEVVIRDSAFAARIVRAQ